MKSALTAVGLAAVLVVAAAATTPPGPRDEQMKSAKENTAQTYEHLATAIIEIRKTEDGLVKGIVMHNAGAADAALARAARGDAGGKQQALERAAEEITNAANEGDKAVQAVRQRLSKAGHTHHTDADTKEDYIWIDGKEKKRLVDLAQRISKMGDSAGADDVNKAREELREIMSGALKDE
jgi:uncharacterized protein (DUF305 family)